MRLPNIYTRRRNLADRGAVIESGIDRKCRYVGAVALIVVIDVSQRD